MVIRLTPDLEAALKEQSRQKGIPPEDLALSALQNQFLSTTSAITPQDEWERRLLTAATDCRVSLPHSALSREALYE